MDNSESFKDGISRRTFLKEAIAGAVGLSGLAALTGCQPAAQAPAAGPTTAPAAGAAAAPAAGPTTAPAQIKAAGKGNVKLLSWVWAETGRNDVWRAFVKDFQAQNSDITIEEVSIPFSQFQDTVSTQFATGAVNADLMTAADTFFLKLQATNLLFNLDGSVDYAQYKSRLEPENDAAVKDGKRYGFALATVPHALIYNKRLYDDNGITKPPTTPDEYIAVGEKIRKAPDIYGFAARNTIPEATGWYIDLCNYVYGFGGRWSTKDGKPTLDSKEVIAAMTYFKRMYDSPAFPRGATAGDYRKIAWQGKLGEYIDNSANMNILKTGDPKLFADIRTDAPPFENKGAVFQGNYICIPAKAKNPDAAARVLEYFLRPEVQTKLTESALDVKQTLKDILSKDYLTKNVWTKGYLLSQTVSSVPIGFETKVPEFSKIVTDTMSQVLTAGKPVADAMGEAQKQALALAQR